MSGWSNCAFIFALRYKNSKQSILSCKKMLIILGRCKYSHAILTFFGQDKVFGYLFE